MKKVCRNCKHFALMCLDSDTYLWGVCQKPPPIIEPPANIETKSDKKVVFNWAEDTCSDFSPRRWTESRQLRKWLEPLKKVLKIS